MSEYHSSTHAFSHEEHEPSSLSIKTKLNSSSASTSSKASNLATFQNLVKPFIGAGILALPKAFEEGGLIASVILMFILSVTVNYCIRQLLKCADVVTATQSLSSQPSTPSSSHSSAVAPEDPSDELNGGYAHVSVPTYRSIGYAAYGNFGLICVDFNLCASQLGFCIAYVSFISSNMQDVESALSRNMWILILFAGFSILSQVRRIEHIAPTSAIGNLVYVVSLSIIFYQGFSSHCCSSDIKYVDFSGLPFLFGTACFALEGAGLVLPVKAGMREASKFSFLLNTAIATVTVAYIVFGGLGYVFYGIHTNSLITKNLDAGILADCVKVSLSISLFFSYAIQLFPVTEMTDEIWDTKYFSKLSHPNESIDNNNNNNANLPSTQYQRLSNSNINENANAHGHGSSYTPDLNLSPRHALIRTFTHSLTRIFIVGFTCVIAIIFPNFGLVVSLVGSLSNSAVAFILPQLFYLKLIVLPLYRQRESDVHALMMSENDSHMHHDDNRVRRSSISSTSSVCDWSMLRLWLLPCVVIVVGVIASILGLYFTIKSAISPDNDA